MIIPVDRAVKEKMMDTSLIGPPLQEEMLRMAARVAELEALLRRADAAVVWETVMPNGRKFQDEVEKALGIGQAANT